MPHDPVLDRAAEPCSSPQVGWDWTPDEAPWFEALARRSSDWKHAPLVLSNEAVFRAALASAIENRRSWLIHPCLSPLVSSRFEQHDAQARMAFWVAINADLPSHAFGSVRFHRGLHLFGRAGDFPVCAGSHRFADLVGMMPDGPPDPIPDPWGNALPDHAAVGDLAATAWWQREPLTESHGKQCRQDILALLKAQRALKSVLPAAHRWLTRMTRVVVPLGAGDPGQFRSGSVAGIPGLVMVEITGSYLLTLEALIHETAHLYFHFCEVSDPLIRADQTQLFTSPLRADPRPLRGIFLAYHALIYMRSFYRDWFAATGDGRCLEALDNLRPLCRDAGATMASAKTGLTYAGRAFLCQCDALADHDASECLV